MALCRLFSYFRCMGFVFPLFLIAGLLLIIPILIHLFNLRRYKHVLFPNTRFLQQLQIASKKSAQLQKKWLLLTRLLFLAALILAFAKPYLGANTDANANRVKVIYIDNSLSMLAKKGQETLLQLAKNQAIQLLNASDKEDRFLIWSNDKMIAMQPMDKTMAQQEITAIKPSFLVVDAQKILTNIQATQDNESKESWSVYLFSDFQKSTFLSSNKELAAIQNTQVYLVPLQVSNLTNLSIDTAYFVDNSYGDNQENQLIVQVKKSGSSETEGSSNLRVQIGQQTKAVTKIAGFNDQNIWRDTVNISLATGWQKVELSLNDFPLNFDDTFRMAIQPLANLSVLVIGEGVIEPHLQAALNSYQGFQLQYKSSSTINSNLDLSPFSLVILQNIDFLSNDLIALVQKKMADGGSVLFFPGKSNDKTALNAAWKKIADISFGSLDTSKQMISGIQENHPLLKDLFSQIPANMQLPTVSKRFPIQAGFNANQQAVMNFKDGSPFMAQYAIDKGKLFLFAASLDIQSSDFALSYFFVPLLYKMAIQAQVVVPAAISIGSASPIWLKSTSDKNKRSVWHLRANEYDAVPVQKPSGSGIDIFLGQLKVQPGFYKLQQEDGVDSILIALNANRAESDIIYASNKEIEQSFKPMEVTWISESSLAKNDWKQAQSGFPIWKICVFIALLCLAAETYLLFQNKKIKEK